MTPLPKPTLEQAVQALKDSDNYRVILEAIEVERDARMASFDDDKACGSPELVMKTAGRVAALDNMLRNFAPQ